MESTPSPTLVLAARDRARSALVAALRPLEERLAAAADPSRHAVVFVIGPPRSGSTLFYDLLVTRFRFAYFSNFAHAFYDIPITATRAAHWRLRRYRGRYESDYGRISSWGAPNEAVRIWRRWLPEEDYRDRPLAEPDAALLRGTLAAMSGIAGAPFVNKNTMHSVHLRVLNAVFPRSLFIEMRRSPEANVRSIVRMRVDKLGSDRLDQWWSVRPRHWESFRGRSPVDQACAQVLLTARDIEADVRALGPERRLVMGYESLCRDPRGSLDAVADFLRRHSTELEVRGEIPEAFPFPPEPVIPSDLDREIGRSLEAMHAWLERPESR